VGHKALFSQLRRPTLTKFLRQQLDKRRSSAHVQKSKCSKCRPLARTHAASLERHSSIALLITLCFMSAQTAIRFCFSSSTSLYCGPASAPISCSRLDSGLGNLEARVFKLKQLLFIDVAEIAKITRFHVPQIAISCFTR